MRHFIFTILLLTGAVSSNAATETNRFILPYPVRDAEFDPVKPRAFILRSGASAIDLVNLDTRASERINLSGFPKTMALSPDAKRLYIAMGRSQNSGSVAVIDAQDFTFLREVQVAINPYDIAATDYGRIIISSDSAPNSYFAVFISEQGTQVGPSSSSVQGRLTLALNSSLAIAYGTEPTPSGAHHHLDFSHEAANTAPWQVPFHEPIYDNRLYPFPDGSRLLSASGHVLSSTTNMQTDLRVLGDTDVNFISSAAFETKQNRIVLLANERVYFVDAGTLQQLESRNIPGAQFVGAYDQRTAVIIRAPDNQLWSEIRWILPEPDSASANLLPTALLFSLGNGTFLPIGSFLNVEVHGRDADGGVLSTRLFSGSNSVSVSSDPVLYTTVKIHPGTNEIYAVVTDSFGATGTSAVHRVYGNYPPQLAVSSLRTSYTNVQPVRIQAQATDQDGEIKTVRLLLNSQVIAQDDTAPYELLFVPPIPGNYSLQLQAEDNHGATAVLVLPALIFQGGTDNYQQGMNVQPSGATNLLLYGSNVDATRQKGEPLHAGVEGGKSIWWAWRVPSPVNSKGGIVSIDTVGSDFDTLLAVYSAVPAGTNDISKLTLLAANDDDITDAPASRVKFFATSSDILYIAVDGREGVAGNVKLRINFQAVPRPPNDNFLAATSTTTGGTGSNVGASKEPGELDHAGNPGGASVWWKLAVPFNSGPIRISTSASRFDTLLAVYTTNLLPRVINATITNLTLIAANDDHLGGRTSDLTFTPPRPGNYWIAVDGYNGAEGMITLTIVSTPAGAPANDHFVSASLLTGTSLLTNGNTLKATREVGEPIHDGKTNSASVWFKWTSPTNGLVSMSTRTSDFDTILAVYRGTNRTTLTPVVANDDDPEAPPSSALRFFASQGIEYFIAVAGYATARGEFVLALNQTPGFSPRLEAEWSQGEIVLDAIDTPGTTLLETSTNLLDWEIAGSLTPSETFNITPSPETRQHFYRLRLQE